jgi:hypothetical protein
MTQTRQRRPRHDVHVIAYATRSALLRFVRTAGYPDGVRNCCTVASLALVQLLREHAHEAHIAEGELHGEVHTWVLVPPPYAVPVDQIETYSTFLDLTADQFGHVDAPDVAVLKPGDAGRMLYALDTFGEATEAVLASPKTSADAELAAHVVRIAKRLLTEDHPEVLSASDSCLRPRRRSPGRWLWAFTGREP